MLTALAKPTPFKPNLVVRAMPAVKFKQFTKFHAMKKALNLLLDFDIGRHGPTYLSREDPTFIVKQYKGKAALKFLPGFVKSYENAVTQMANEDINGSIEVVPFLHVGMDFIVKPWITQMYPVNSIEHSGIVRDKYLNLIHLIKTRMANPELKETLLRSANKGTSYFDYKNNKLLFTDLDFA